MEEGLKAMASFAQAHPTEVITLEFQNILDDCPDCSSTGDVRQVLLELIEKQLIGCKSKVTDGLLNCEPDMSVPLKELRSNGQIIIYSLDSKLYDLAKDTGMVHLSCQEGDECAGQPLMYKAWYNTNELATLKSKMQGDAALNEIAMQGNTTIGLQWMLTPQKHDFLGAVTQKWTSDYQDKANSQGCQSLACFAEVASATEFEEFYALSQEFPAIAMGNILMIDYADREGTMEAVMNINKGRRSLSLV